MTVNQQLISIIQKGVVEGKSSAFMALAHLHFMDNQLSLSIQGNGFLDDDEETSEAIYGDDVTAFVREACASVA